MNLLLFHRLDADHDFTRQFRLDLLQAQVFSGAASNVDLLLFGLANVEFATPKFESLDY